VQQELGIGDKQNHKAPEEDGMVKTKTVTPGNGTSLSKRVKQCVPDTLTDVIETVFWFAQGHQAETPETAPAKSDCRYDKDSNK
jgi:hypothetical protein